MQVKTLTGRKQSFTFDGSATILEVKKQLMEKEGIDVKQIRLIFSGKQLCVRGLTFAHILCRHSDDDARRNDTDTLDGSKIVAGETIHMVLSLRGGASL